MDYRKIKRLIVISSSNIFKLAQKLENISYSTSQPLTYAIYLLYIYILSTVIEKHKEPALEIITKLHVPFLMPSSESQLKPAIA